MTSLLRQSFASAWLRPLSCAALDPWSGLSAIARPGPVHLFGVRPLAGRPQRRNRHSGAPGVPRRMKAS